MKPSSLTKTFGIISYFPDNDSDYHIEMRRERSRRFRELLAKIEEYWGDLDIIVIAQNWQDFELPQTKNKITVYHYDKLGILGARKELRKKFLETDYDYLIMVDDDAMVNATDPQGYLDLIDSHPDGVGAIRWIHSTLQLFAISRTVYKQIEMPDVDPEKSQGFEDDVFAARCKAQFADVAFDIPESIVTETSLHYQGPGACPSTWAKEKKYDWNHMYNHTNFEIHRAERTGNREEIADDVEPTIDLIITYVNGSDRNWINDYIRTTKTHNPSAVRYRSWGTLKYLLRGVEQYMPFIRDVVLVISRKSQLPSWIDESNVRVVYHEDFIPKQFLPTFNSCTIESFFWNIPDLADRVISFNDDMFPVSMLHETDFFTDDIPHIKFSGLGGYSSRNIFRSQCRSGIDLITRALELPPFEAGKIIRPEHIAIPITRESMDKIGELCKNTLPATISPVRLHKNVNQYIYVYYHYFTDNYVNQSVDYDYYEISETSIQDIMDIIVNGYFQMICINDSDKIKNFSRLQYLLQNSFEAAFPDKSRYER